MMSESNVSWSSSFEKFCDTTTIHGVTNVFGNQKKFYIRLLWAILLLVMICLLVYQSIVSLELYFEFKIQTAITYESNSNILTFPAITLCTRTVMRRSVVGGQKSFLQIVSTMFYGSYPCLLKEVDKENELTCSRNYNTTPLPGLESNLMGLIDKNGYFGFMKLISLTSTTCLTKCWFKKKRIKCRSIVIDRFTDDGICFTVNPSMHENDINKKIFGPIIDVEVRDNILNTTNFGPENGLQLLLNVHQDEYCGEFKGTYTGSGFNAFIHDQSEAGSVHQSATMLLKAGTVYNLMLQPITYLRKTEHLGKCKSKTKIANINLEGSYSESACKLLCQMQYIWDHCGCLVVAISGNTKTISAILGITADEKDICNIDKFGCMNKFLDIFTKNTDSTLCQECLPQCSQTIYQHYLSETKFPSNNINSYFEQYLQTGNITENFKKNYLVLNMYFGEMNGQTITESQKYTLLDLFITISNGLGLFVGMSVISLFEPLYFLLHSLQQWISSFKQINWKRKQSKVVFSRRATNTFVLNTFQVVSMVDIEHEY